VVRNKGAPASTGSPSNGCRVSSKRAGLRSKSTAPGALPAAAGASGEDPEAGRRDAQLGIPTVIDRVIQQAVLQRLQPRWDPTFSEHSYGFRPGRSAHQAVVQAQAYVIDGYRFVVDIDLAKFSTG